MMCDDSTQRGCRLKIVQPVRPPSGANSLYEKPLTAPADRAAAFASSIRVAAGYVWRRLNPRSFIGRCNGSRPPAPESRRPVCPILSRCLKCALRRTMRVLPAQRPRRVLLAWVRRRTHRRPRCVASSSATLHDSATWRVASGHPAGFPGTHAVRVILKEPHPRAA